MANSTTWNTVGSTTRDLYLIVPSSVTCSSGSPGITLSNSTQFASSLDVLFYTPCQFSATNDTGVMGQGQVYAGTWAQGNEFNLTTRRSPPLPVRPEARPRAARVRPRPWRSCTNGS